MYLHVLPLLASYLLTVSAHDGDTPAPFNPRAYEPFKQTASCKAVHRRGGGEAVPDEVHIDIGYVNINPSASRTLVMVHGWPAMWTTWSRQIPRFEKDYHLVVPDLRGFASSSHPGDVEASGTMADLVGDLVCILDHAGVENATCVGHDWGSQVCWEAARMRPDRFEAVAGVVVPYISSAGPFAPVEELAKTVPKLAYQVFFEKSTQGAVAELNQDIRRSLRSCLRNKASPPPDSFLISTTSFLEAYSEFDTIDPPPFLSQEEEDYMVEEFSKQGFDHTLQFYTYSNRYESWKFAREQGNFTIPQPALFVAPLDDPVADWLVVAKLLGTEKFVPHLTTKTMNTHHWPHLEEPEEFNQILGEWLSNLDVLLAEVELEEREKAVEAAKAKLHEAKVKRSGEEL